MTGKEAMDCTMGQYVNLGVQLTNGLEQIVDALEEYGIGIAHDGRDKWSVWVLLGGEGSDEEIRGFGDAMVKAIERIKARALKRELHYLEELGFSVGERLYFDVNAQQERMKERYGVDWLSPSHLRSLSENGARVIKYAGPKQVEVRADIPRGVFGYIVIDIDLITSKAESVSEAVIT